MSYNTGMLRTGVSDYLNTKNSKKYEIAEKPNYVNPFNTNSSSTIDRDSTQDSPKKRVSIERRHTDNYAVKRDQNEDNTPTDLSP